MELYDTVKAFKAVQLMCPGTINTLHPTKADLNQLRAFPFLDTDDVIGGLADELPLYLAMATDVTFQGASTLLLLIILASNGSAFSVRAVKLNFDEKIKQDKHR